MRVCGGVYGRLHIGVFYVSAFVNFELGLCVVATAACVIKI